MKNSKTTFKLTGALLFISLLLFVNCKKKSKSDPEEPGMTVNESKVFITNSFTDLTACITTLNNGDLANLVYSFSGLSNGDALNDNWMDLLHDKFDLVQSLSQIEDDLNFSMSYYQGNYSWNSGSQTWSKSPLSNAVIVNFPSSPSASNDCVLNITQATFGTYYITNDTLHLPQNVSYTVSKNGTVVSSMNISGTYNTSGFPSPQNLTINFFIAPFNYVITINQLTATHFEFNYSMQNGSSCETEIFADVSFNNNDFENLDITEDLTTVIFNVEKGDLRIEGTWDAQTYYSINNPSPSQINNTINWEVFSQQQKIGDLRFFDPGNGNNELYIYYNDGTSENTSIYHDPFVNDLDALLSPKWGSIN